MAFDIEGARKAGYSDSEITEYLGSDKDTGFDVAGAQKAGYSPSEILDFVGTQKAATEKGFFASAKDALSKRRLETADIEPASDNGMPGSVMNNVESATEDDLLQADLKSVGMAEARKRQFERQKNAEKSSIQNVRGPEPSASNIVSGLAKSLPQGAEQARQGIRAQFADAAGFDSMSKDALRKASQASLETTTSTPEFESSTAKGVYGGVSSAIRMVPGLAAAAATKSSAPLLATMGAQTEAEAYAKYRNRGASGGMAALAGVGEGATEVATELLPMGFLVKNMGKAGAGRFLTGLLAREVPSEQVATLVQDAIDTAVANPDKTWAQYAAERPDAAYQTLVSTVTQAGIMQGANSVAKKITGYQSPEAQAEQSANLAKDNALNKWEQFRQQAAPKPTITDIQSAPTVDDAIATAQAVIDSPSSPALNDQQRLLAELEGAPDRSAEQIIAPEADPVAQSQPETVEQAIAQVDQSAEPTAMQIAMERASQAAADREAIRAARRAELTTPVSQRQTAQPVSPIVQFRADAAQIESGLPPVANGDVRLWRGNRPGEEGVATTYTNDLPGIALPFKKSYGGELTYVDVPASDLPKYENKAGAAPGAEFNLPGNIANKAKTFQGQANDINPVAAVLPSASAITNSVENTQPAPQLAEAGRAPIAQPTPIAPANTIEPAGSATDSIPAASQAVESVAALKPKFQSPHEFGLSDFYSRAEKGGISKEQAKMLEPSEALDSVTGFNRAETKVPTVERAQEYVDQTGETAHFVDGDIANLGGINAHFKNNANEANKAYRAITDIFSEEMNKAGSNAIMIRHGGDEVSAVVIGGTTDSVSAAITRAKKRVQEYAKSAGLSEIPHSKHKGNLKFAGTGLHLGQAEIQSGVQLDDIFSAASRDLDKTKNQGVNDVTGNESAQAGPSAPTGESRGVREASEAGRDGARGTDEESARGTSGEENATKAKSILDAAGIKGGERIERLKDIRSGAITLEELQQAYPAEEAAKPEAAPEEPSKPDDDKALQSQSEQSANDGDENQSVLSDPSPEEANKVERGIEGKSAVHAALFVANHAPNKAHRAIASRVSVRLRQLEKAGAKFNLHVAHIGDDVPSTMAQPGVRGQVSQQAGDVETHIWIQGADAKGKVGVSYETVLHELVHAATQKAIDLGEHGATGEIGNSVQALRDLHQFLVRRIEGKWRAKEELNWFEQHFLAGKNNTLDSMHELVSWGMTNKETQQYLESVPYKNTTLWGQFVASVRKFLGLDATHETALSEVIGITDKLLSIDAATLTIEAMRQGTTMSQNHPHRSIVNFSRQSTQNAGQPSATWIADAPSIPEETGLQGKRRIIQDKFNRFKVLQESVEMLAAENAGFKGGDIHQARAFMEENGVANPVNDATDVYQSETLMSGKISTRKEDFRERQMKPLIEKTFEAGLEMSQIGDFLKIQHAPEANKRARELQNDKDATAFGISDERAAKEMADFKALPNYDKLKEIANEWRAITDQSKKILLDAGIVSQDVIDAWEATYSVYVPVKGSESKSGLGKGLSVNGKQKMRLGHSERDESILENILRDHERAISNDEVNQVGLSLIRFGLAAKNPDIMTIDKPTKRKIVKDAPVHEVLYQGNFVAAFETKSAADAFVNRDAIVSKRPTAGYSVEKTTNPYVALMTSPMLEEHEVNVYVAGHAVRIQLNDEIAARAYKNMGVEGLGAILSVGREVNSWLSKVYTGYSPDFILTNPIRDAIQGSVTLTGEHGAVMAAKVFANYPHAAKELIKHFRKPGASKLVTEYRAAGGSTGAAYLSDLERIGNDVMGAYNEYAGVMNTYHRVYAEGIEKGYGETKARTYAMAKSGAAGFRSKPIVGHVLNLIERINSVTENALRVATYKTLIDNGVSQPQAAAQAKNLMNFNRKGEMSNQAGALYLFFNPAVQGTTILAESLGTSKHKYQARALAGTMTLFALALAELARGGDDDDEKKWKQTPTHVKDRNMIVGFGEYQFMLPVPYGYGIFHTLGNTISDFIHGEDGYKLGIRLASSMFGQFSPIGNPMEGKSGVFAVSPTIFKMAGGPAMNQNSFGQEIAPKAYSDAKPDSQLLYRSTKGSNYEAVAAGMNSLTGGSKFQKGAIDVSPETLKYWVKGLTGGAGQFVFDSVNIPTMATQGVAPNPKDIPVVRRFVREIGVTDARSAFWEKANEVKAASDSFAAARNARDSAAAKEIFSENKALISLADYSRATQAMVKAKRDEFDRIKLDETMSLATKREKMKLIEMKETAIYQKFIREFEARTQSTKRAAN